MPELTRRMSWEQAHHSLSEPEFLLTYEWLVANGLGGYASGTVAGVLTRRYHGLLIASLPAPLGRIVMLSHLAEELEFADGKVVYIGGGKGMEDATQPSALTHLTDFALECGLPVWRYEVSGVQIEKRVLLAHMQNTVYVTYRVLHSSGPIGLRLRPLMLFRAHGAEVSEPPQEPYQLSIIGERYEISAPSEFPPLRLLMQSAQGDFTVDRETVRSVFYRREAERGYDSHGVLWSPGYFSSTLEAGEQATVIASTEAWTTILALPVDEAATAERRRRQQLLAAAVPEARVGTAAELVLAADQFIVTPAGRIADTARARAAGDEVRSIIAGYHWFTDWGRDTMISLEGLTLITGRHLEAGWILRAFARYIRDGLIPNLFPEGENEGLYHTADATLWFFHALDRYLEVTQDRATLSLILPKLLEIIEHHRHGTRFDIAVDERDGLLRQGREGYQLTWMDAKVDDWVVTPRRGKAVEINALWYNALRLLEGWVRDEQGESAAKSLGEYAEQAYYSFNRRFWYDEGGYLYDVIDGPHGNDSACRPNQILAISLHHPILDPSRWEAVINIVHQHLLTPVGLRSLSPGQPDYKSKYFGDLRDRDAAYHQGTVWPWLIGPFIDAWLCQYPDDRAKARSFLEGFIPHLGEGCLGTVSEIFDAEPPYTLRGCVAQAWSVAELLRCWVKTAEQ
jgi:predicted glycogen debranching enzyme